MNDCELPPADDKPLNDSTDNPPPDECVVVGIGASAGGLEAYKRLLRQMSENTGMAFVLVQHLDPTHQSLMVELLAKYTAMPVLQVEGPTPIQPNHVYMIPPNRFITIKEGGLFLEQPVIKRGVRLPIDYFFRSLAQARRERSVCIVLSGTGSDGADGLREVKGEGGMTIVQQPDTAEYDGMPRAALSTGAVDYVLPIDEMPDVIVSYSQHPYVRAKPNTTLADTSPDHYRAILNLLRAHTDQDFSRYKKGTLTRRIERRMGIRHIENAANYLKLLREDGDEVRELFKDMLIGVTRFFRDPAAWDKLMDTLLLQLADKRTEEPVRVWVPGCSSGEEAYTLAISLFELQDRLNKRLDIQIFATDIDSAAVDVARLGVYPEAITKDITDDRIDAYFHREGEKLRVKKKVREVCVFAVQNLLSDPPFSNLDLISCRNLLIYLESDIQQRVFDMFHFALKPRGILFLGNSESPAKGKKHFEVVSQASRLYHKVGASKPGGGGFPVNSSKPRATPNRATTPDASPRPVGGTVEISKKTLLDEFAPASVVIDGRGIIQYIHGPVRNYLDFPTGEPDMDLFAMAVTGLRFKVRSAVQQARTAQNPVSVVAPGVRRDESVVSVRVRVQSLPVTKDSGPLFLCSFTDEPLEAAVPESAGGLAPAAANAAQADRQLALELQAAREDLQSTVEELESANEELKASNEEVMSMNEELQSTNEELETSREELQSLNEELSTVNNQLHDKVDLLEATTNDLSNLLASTDMATLFLDSDLRIRRFTPATVRLMSLIDSDIGRPISDLAPRVNDPNMVADARDVLDRLAPIEKEVQNGGSHWYMRRITPFRTADNKIDGVVITFSDVTKLKDSSRWLEFRERQQAVIAKLGRAALAGDDLGKLFDRAVREVAGVFHADYAKLLRLQSSKKELFLEAGTGWQDGLVGHARLPAGIESQGGYTLQVAGPVFVEDLSKEKRFAGPQLLIDHEVVSGISVIVGPEDNPWGVLGVHAKRHIEFTIDDGNFVQAVANVLWAVIRRDAIQNELQDTQSRMEAFLNNSAVIGWMKDDAGRYVYLSPNYERFFGVQLADWQGKTDHDVWPADLADQYVVNDREVLEQGESVEVIEPSKYLDGRDAHFISSKFLYSDSYGNRYVGGLGVDITERVQTEQRLAESETRLRLAARIAGFGTYYADAQTGEVSWSAEMKELCGLSPETETPVRVGEIPSMIHPDDAARVREKVRASLDPSGDGEFYDEHRIVRPDGQIMWVLMQGQTVFEDTPEGTRPLYAAGVALDITDRHRYEDELQEARLAAEAANEAKSRFLAHMSHELRTPMTAIMGFADVLRARLQDPEAMACAKTIKENGQYLTEILNDVLDLSKIEAGKQTARPESVSLIALLADVRSLLGVRADEKSITLAVECEGPLPAAIRTDPKLFRQVLTNLVGNAIKFTDTGGVRMVAACSADQELLTVSVIDTGVGISRLQLDRLFLPFEQADNTSTRMSAGTGLGLTISKALVELLGGQITAESEPGKGSVFRFTVPTGPLENVEWSHPSPDVLRSSLNAVTTEPLPQVPGRVLVVDDRPDIRVLVRQFLEDVGSKVETAENGSDAVQTWATRRDAGLPVDAIVMDMRMPVMDGLEATRRLRAEGYRGPILALTANAMRGDAEQCFQAGCDDFLAKPIDRVELVRKLAALLERHRVPNSTGTPEHTGQSKAGVTVLHVEDNEDNRHLTKLLLEHRGYSVVSAGSGPEALELAKQLELDVVLLDLGLVGMSGVELIRELKQLPSLADSFYVCVSGQGKEDVPWKDLGFDYYSQKPSDIEELDRIIKARTGC